MKYSRSVSLDLKKVLLLCKQQSLFTEVPLEINSDRLSQQETQMQMHHIDLFLCFPLANPRVQPAVVYAGESSVSQSTRLPVPAQ